MGILSENSLQDIHEYWVDIDRREIWIHGFDTNIQSDYEGNEPGVDYMMANRVIKNLHMLRYASAKKPVVVHLHTCGGIWEEGMALYDTIRMMPYPVTMVSYTHARSMSSIILQAADTRLMLPNSCFMFHYGTLAVGGHAPTVHSNVDFARQNDQTMLSIYVERCFGSKHFKKKSREEVRAELAMMMDKKGDVFLTAQQAVDWGFADGILENWSDLK